MKDETYTRRREEERRIRAYPHGREAGDYNHHPSVVEEMRKKMDILLYWHTGHSWEERVTHKTYSAPRYYAMSVHPEKGPAVPTPPEQVMYLTITRHDLGRWAVATFPEQNMLLEEWWLKNGGD